MPEAKLLVLLRDPVERLVSFLNHVRRAHDQATSGSPGESFATRVVNLHAFPSGIYSGLYARHLERLFELFDPSQVLVLQYECCKARPEQELARTYKFLGIDEGFTPQQTRRPVNVNPYVIPRPDDERKHSFARYFEDDVARLKQLLPGLDLSLWPNFAHLAPGRGDVARAPSGVA